jgi:hypothetical protein
VIFAVENPKNQVLEVEDVLTLGPMAQAALVMYEGMSKALMATEKFGR